MKDGLYHRDLGFPAELNLASFLDTICLEYSRHAMLAAVRDRYNGEQPVIWPQQLPVVIDDIIEVQVEDGAPVKAVVRVPYDGARDLVFVIQQPRGHVSFGRIAAFVRTVWINLRSDAHSTLDASKYLKP